MDLINKVDEGNAIATTLMNRLDNALDRMNNNGVNTTQMLANMLTFICNVGGGQLHDRVTPVIERMLSMLDKELDEE